MRSWLAVCSFGATLLAGNVERAPMWLTFDVVNPEASGQHRILVLEDVLSARRDIPDLPTTRGLLIVATTLDACGAERGLCQDLEQVFRRVRAEGGLTLGLLIDPPEILGRARADIPGRRFSFPVVADTRGIARRALGLERAGDSVLIHADGRLDRLSGSGDGAERTRLSSVEGLSSVEEIYVRALKRAKQDEE